jgi:hypothetical protein
LAARGIDSMRHFLFVGERAAAEVLGVWEVRDDLSAARLRLQLSLMYPGCRTVSDLASDYETFKTEYEQYDFGALEPERIELR